MRGPIATGRPQPAELSMLGLESQLNLTQHRLRLVALLGQLTRGNLALRADGLHERPVCESVLPGSLVTLSRGLRGSLREEGITGSARLLLGSDGTGRMCHRLRIG